MTRLFLFVLLFLGFASTTSAQDSYDSIYVGNHWRTFQVHLPTNYSASIKVPLVVAYHGGGPLGYQSIQYQSRLTSKSDSAGFVLVYPEGMKIAGNRTWNAGGCCAPSTTLNIDDIAFTNSLLDYLFLNYSIDTLRVYATGFSNGALLCYRIADQLTNRFAAIAPVAGNLLYYPWNPSRAIPIISFHSYQDQNVNYFGGITVGSTGVYFPPQDSVLTVIGTNYNCSNLKDTLYHNTSQYDHFLYANCNCNGVIEQYVSYDGDHSWPGGLSSPGVNVSNQFSATFLMWEFFQNYTTICYPLEVMEMTGQIPSIYPNPSDKFIQLGNIPETEFRIVNSIGQVEMVGKTKGVIHVEFLKNGTYFLELNDCPSKKTLRFYHE